MNAQENNKTMVANKLTSNKITSLDIVQI